MRSGNKIRSTSAENPPCVELEGVTKSFGSQRAVDGLSLRIDRGEVHALLGPNGSGKSTTVRLIATLLRPDAGEVPVLRHDTVRDASEVKKRLGLVGQFVALDLRLTGMENLTMLGALAGLPGRKARERAHDLLEQFRLAEAADRLISGWSGGMRRRLDILAAFVVRPSVLLLDEPTTGLDPASRLEVYDMVRGMVADGTTVILTTQYLDEADQLADRLTILNHGRAVASGPPVDIKRMVGEGIHVVVEEEQADRAEHAAAFLGLQAVARESGDVVGTTRLGLAVDDGHHRPALVDVLREMDRAGVGVDDIGRRHPSLDEAFLALTGPSNTAARRADDHQEGSK